MTKKIIYLLLIAGLSLHIAADTNNNNDCQCSDICSPDETLLVKSGNVYGKTFYWGRSQGRNLARRMVGMENRMHAYGNECYYAIPNIAVEYQQNFRSERLGIWFGDTGNQSMTYGYTGASFSDFFNQTRTFDINAADFAYTGSGTISFCPKKSDLIVDLDVYIALDPIFCGGWIRVDLPFVKTDFDIGLTVKETGAPSSVISNIYDISNEDVGATIPAIYKNFKEALLGDKKVYDYPALKYGKICGKKSDTSVANIRIDFGYDWFRRPCWHFSSAFDVILPVGTKPNAEFLFEPIVGNAHRFELGGAYDFAYELWHNCDQSKTFSLYINGYFNTVFSARNKRLMGLKLPSQSNTESEKIWSQYSFLLKLNNSQETIGLERAANILAGDIKVDASFEGAVAFMLQYNCNCYMTGLGYEIWGRTREKIKSRCFEIPDNTYIDDVEFFTGDPLKFVTNDSILYSDALHTATHSNKLFGFFGYNWWECFLKPFVLIEAEVEFGAENRAYSQWGVLAKGGIEF